MKRLGIYTTQHFKKTEREKKNRKTYVKAIYTEPRHDNKAHQMTPDI